MKAKIKIAKHRHVYVFELFLARLFLVLHLSLSSLLFTKNLS